MSLLMISGEVMGQTVNERMITGRVLDTITKKSIADVIVVNKRTNKTSLTDKDGYFYISGKWQDSLIFYLIGYHPKYLHLIIEEQMKKQVMLIFLRPNIEELRQVEVTAEKEKAEEKYPFNQVPSSAMSPISFLYERYSRKYKQYRKIEEMEKEKSLRKLKESRMSREFIMDITDIEEEEVDRFIKQCRFSEEFLRNANDYDFIVAVKKKYQYFSEKR